MPSQSNGHKRNRSLVGLLDLQHLRSLKISTSESRAIQCCQIHVLLFQMDMKSTKKLDQSRTEDGKLTTTVSEKPELFNRVSYIAPPFFSPNLPARSQSLKAERLMIVTVFGADKLQQEYSIGHDFDQITSWSSLECDEYPPDRPVPTRWKITFF